MPTKCKLCGHVNDDKQVRCQGEFPDGTPCRKDLVGMEEDKSEIRTDGGEDLGDFDPDGAIDNDFDDAEQSPEEQLTDAASDFGHQHLEAGDVALDLVTRQLLYVRCEVADSVIEYFDDADFDLANYNGHPYLPVTIHDTVYECVFLPASPEGLHKIKQTYDYPGGRLARVPVELAWEGDDADM